MIPSRLVIATANPGKAAELASLVREWGGIDEVLSLADVGGVALPPETGATYLENAARKAAAVVAATGIAALADDSGLEVDALGGGPGVHSARYAPSDPARIARLLSALDGVVERGARFRCVVGLAWPDGREDHAEGLVEGRIALAATGEGGFGYDPVFVPDELGVTFAAAGAAAKARISHRSRAVRALGVKLGAQTLRPPGAAC